MSPHCRGTSFGAPNSVQKMDPVLGPALGRVPEMSVSSVAVLCVATVGSLTSMPVSVRSHRRPIPDAGSGGFLVEMVAAGGGRYWSEGSGVNVAGLMAGSGFRRDWVRVG